MNVLLVSGTYPPDIGGPSAQTQQIAAGLQRRGHVVSVLTFGDPGEELQGGVRVRRIPGRRGRTLVAKGGNAARLWRALWRTFREARPDVVHVQTAAGPLAYAVAVIARLHGVPSMVKYSSEVFWEATCGPRSGWKRAAFSQLQRLMFVGYGRVWATTPEYLERLATSYRLPAARRYFQPNFLDLERFAAATPPARGSGPVRLLMLARIIPMKGIDVAIEAMRHLRDLDVVLHVVGAGKASYLDTLRQEAVRAGVADRVHFDGPVSPDAAPGVLAAGDVFVLASREEAFGIALVEAMAAGLPLVATRVGGVPFVTEEGRSALLVPPGDGAALAAAVRSVVSDAALRARLVAAGRERAKAFALEAGLDALGRSYDTLRAAHGAGTRP